MEDTDMLKILYCTSRDFRFQDEKLPTKGEIEEHWQELPGWVVKYLLEDGLNREEPFEEIYRRMNHYDTNPLAVQYPFKGLLTTSTGQEWMKANGVGHTSMSMGDIIVVNGHDDTKNGYYYCMSIGFDKIHSI